MKHAIPSSLFLLVLLLLVLPSFAQPPFKVGLVRDSFLKYAEFDEFIYNGTAWWAQWVNARGGLVYNGTAHHVEIVSLDASTPDPNQTVYRVREAYESLINDYKVNILVSPDTSLRSSIAMSVSKKYNVINFVTGALSDALFESNDTWSFNQAFLSSKAAQKSLELLVAKGAKTYTVLRRPDAVSLITTIRALEYLESKGLVKLRELWVNYTATDNAQLTTLLRGSLAQLMDGISTDIFIYGGHLTEFSNIATVFQELLPDAKAAVHLLNNPRNLQTKNKLGNAGDYWILTTRFDKDFQEGISGELGGTTAEFIQDFTKRMGTPATFLDALTASLLMSYYHIVNQTGTIDAFTVREAMRNMPQIQTFTGPIQFYQNGTNKYAKLEPIQLVNGGRLLSASNLIYPAPFKHETSVLSTTKVIAIAVPIGLVVLIAVVLGIIYMRRQRKQVVKVLEKTEEGQRRNYRIDYSSLTLAAPLRADGLVFKGEYRGAEVAIKKLKKQTLTKTQLDEFAKESAIMIGLRHPNILLFMGVCIDPPNLAIITEFMPYGSLYDIAHNDRFSFPFPLVKNIMLDILKGLQFIHSANLVHRNLKSSNLLVDKNWNIKIADFGISVIRANAGEDTPSLWTAPEILTQTPGCYTEKSDIYSFAIISWELLSREIPYNNIKPSAITQAVVGGVRPPLDASWDPTASSIVSACWDIYPSRRPTVVETRDRVETILTDPNFSMSSIKRFLEKMQQSEHGSSVLVSHPHAIAVETV